VKVWALRARHKNKIGIAMPMRAHRKQTPRMMGKSTRGREDYRCYMMVAMLHSSEQLKKRRYSGMISKTLLN